MNSWKLGKRFTEITACIYQMKKQMITLKPIVYASTPDKELLEKNVTRN